METERSKMKLNGQPQGQPQSGMFSYVSLEYRVPPFQVAGENEVERFPDRRNPENQPEDVGNSPSASRPRWWTGLSSTALLICAGAHRWDPSVPTLPQNRPQDVRWSFRDI